MDLHLHLQSLRQKGKKALAVLIDPDSLRLDNLDQTIALSVKSGVDFFLIGGSLILNDEMDLCLEKLRKESNIPLILFPGSTFQISNKADALLFLSLISGRNAELLIGKHVITAPLIKQSDLEVISTGYMIIDGGVPTAVQYMSNTNPIPTNKPDIAVCTAMAGEMLGLKLIYMDAGSGAKYHIPVEMIHAVRASIDLPLIVGGGIRSAQTTFDLARAGADIIVVGNAIEQDPALIIEMKNALSAAEKGMVKSPQK